MRPGLQSLIILTLFASCTPQPVQPPSPALPPTASAQAPTVPSLPASVPWPCAQQGDIDGDQQPDKVLHDRARAVIEVQGKAHPIPLPTAAITRVCLGNLDGDDRAEVLVGVVRPTEKDQTFRERVFVYRFDGRALRPHFLGTQGGGQLLYFGVADLDDDGKAELIVREVQDDQAVTRVYGWEGYGFQQRQELVASAPKYAFHPAFFAQPSFADDGTTGVPHPSRKLSWERSSASARGVTLRKGLSNVANRGSFRWLNTDARRRLEQDGFVVIQPASPPPEFHALYIQNQYDAIPSFITADAALHFTHLVFDDLLQDTEQNVMGPALARLVSGMRWQAGALSGQLPPSLVAPLHRVTLRLALAEAILTGSLHHVASEDRAAVQRELDAIDRRAGERSEIKVDYATFEVRGHYTKTEALGRFFKAQLLLSSSSVADPREVALMSALALTDPIHRHLLSALDRLGRELVGPPASHTPLALLERARARWGDSPQWADLDTGDAWYGPLPLVGQRSEPVVTLLARRWPSDNDVLSGADRTSLPDPLELLAALGSNRARSRLYPEATSSSPATSRLDRNALAFRTGELGDPDAAAGRWLLALRWVLLPFPEGYPAFQRTDAWADHGLVTAAASWTELRRDTILYVQPPIVWAEGGDEEALPPGKAAYVEPIPELYRELSDVLGDVGAAIERLSGASTPGMIARSRALLQLFESAARRQLAGEPLTREEHLTLQRTGEEFEEILAGKGTLRLDPVPVIADVVHLQDPTTSARTGMLMAATGELDVVVVAVPLGNRVVLARGAVSSFHHFVSPTFITDEVWREQLERGAAPERPDWARSVRGSGGVIQRSTHSGSGAMERLDSLH